MREVLYGSEWTNDVRISYDMTISPNTYRWLSARLQCVNNGITAVIQIFFSEIHGYENQQVIWTTYIAHAALLVIIACICGVYLHELSYADAL